MENLAELVRRTLRERGEEQDVFAARLGITRQHLGNWARTLPAARTLRAIAADLSLPYGQVLIAALHGRGFAETVGDVVGGLPVQVVFRDDTANYDEDYDEEPPVAVFSAADAANTFKDVSNQVSAGRYEVAAVIIDGAPVPEHVVMYSTVWDRLNGIEQSEWLYSKIPAELEDRQVSDVKAGVLGNPRGIFELRVLSRDKESGKAAVHRALVDVQARDQILPSHVPAPNFLHRAAAMDRAASWEHMSAAADVMLSSFSVPPPPVVTPSAVVDVDAPNAGETVTGPPTAAASVQSDQHPRPRHLPSMSAGPGGPLAQLGPFKGFPEPPIGARPQVPSLSELGASWSQLGGLTATNFFGINSERRAAAEQAYINDHWIPAVSYMTIRPADDQEEKNSNDEQSE